MDTAVYLPRLRRDLDAFEACLGGDLDAPVEHCGDWTLYDLADHLGHGNLWSATAVTDKRGDYDGGPPAPRAREGLVNWFSASCDVLVTALEADPSTEAWTFWPPRTVAFWRRRRCLETVVHLWDAGHALGEARPIDEGIAADGVAEVFDTFYPRQVQKGRAEEPEQAVRITASDTGGEWVLGPGEPVATIGGTAESLLLMLWGRLSPEDASIQWDGDRAAGLRVLDRPIVP